MIEENRPTRASGEVIDGSGDTPLPVACLTSATSNAVSELSDFDVSPEFLHGRVQYPAIQEDVSENEGGSPSVEGEELIPQTDELQKEKDDQNESTAKHAHLDLPGLHLSEAKANTEAEKRGLSHLGQPLSTITKLPPSTNPVVFSLIY